MCAAVEARGRVGISPHNITSLRRSYPTPRWPRAGGAFFFAEQIPYPPVIGMWASRPAHPIPWPPACQRVAESMTRRRYLALRLF